jgi:formylglycine-generating enzyme required for sulfatase activity
MKKFLTILLAAILAVSGCRKYDDSHVWDTLFDLTVEQQKHAERLAALEAWQATVNDNIWALQTVVGALENNDYVTAVTPFTEPAPGGYYIDFSKSGRATIKNGEKGDTGDKGADGATPQIGVAQYPDDSGVYYWTLNGDWLLNGNGEKIPVTGEKGDKGDTGDKGDQGDKGDTGANGITPKLRINASTNEWEVCTNGTCAQETDWVSLGIKATGEKGEKGDTGDTGAQGDAIFAANGVDNTNPDYVIFTLADNSTTIQVPKYRPLSITFEQSGTFTNSETKPVEFTYTGAVKSLTAVDVPRGWTVSAATFSGSTNTGTFTVTAPADDGKYYTAAGTATLLVSDGAERTITAPLALACSTPYTPPAGLDIRFAEDSYTMPAFKNGNTKAVEFATTAATSVTVVDVPQGWTVNVTHDAATGAGTFSITAPADGLHSGAALALASGDGGKTAGLPLALTLEPVDSGSAGSSCSWTLTGVAPNYTLTISGSGAMEDYDIEMNPTPWFNDRNNIKTVVIADGVTHIGNYAFDMCTALTFITIPNSVTTIGRYVFYNCSGLTAVTIPNSVTNIGTGAFATCTALHEITSLNPAPPSLDGNIFYGVSTGNITLKAPANAVSAYKAAWGGFGSYIPVYADGGKLDIAFTQPVAFTLGQPQNIVFTVTAGYAENLTAVDVPRGWTVSAAAFGSNNTGTFTVTPPAADAKDYAATGTATLIVSDGAERTITKSLVLSCPAYEALGISFAQPAAFCAGETAVTFTTTGNATTVKALDVPAGWTVTVTKDGAAGTFTVTAPGSGGSEGEAVILVSDAAGKTVMRTLALTPTDTPTVTAVSSVNVYHNTPAATLTATVGAGLTDAMTYTWDVGGAVTTTYAPTLITGNPTTTTTYTVTATNACYTSAVSDAGTITVTVCGSGINTDFTVNGATFKMVAVEGGTFRMGTDSELPIHSVTLSDFHIGETEVTQDMWQAVMGRDNWPGDMFPDDGYGGDRSVYYVSWNDVVGVNTGGNSYVINGMTYYDDGFCYKLSQAANGNVSAATLNGATVGGGYILFRLPTEAEWEYAARGGRYTHGYTYSGSNTVGDVAWYNDNAGGAELVKTKNANELGIYDMSGNACEWVWDWYGYDYNAVASTDDGGSVVGAVVDPIGVTSGSKRVARGGSWTTSPPSCRVAIRGYNAPSNRYNGYGFRLAGCF